MAHFLAAYWMPVSLGLIGATFAESTRQYQRWCQLDAATFQAQFRSIRFWLLLSVVLAVAGVTAAFLHDDSNGSVRAINYLAAGAGTLAFIRTGIAAIVARISPARIHRLGTYAGGAEVDKLTWHSLLS